MSAPTNIFAASTQNIFYADESLANKSAGTCDLFILVDKYSLQIALRQRRSNTLIAFEVIDHHAEYSGINTSLSNSKILRSHEFSKVKIAFASSRYTLVPEALFRSGDEQKYFQHNFSLLPGEMIRSGKVSSFHLYSIFSCSSEMEKELNHLFQDAEIIHQSQSFLNGISFQNKSNPGKQLWLNVRKNEIDLIAWDNKKLILMNSFAWQTNEDILYYTLFVCEQLEINPSEIPVTYSGEIEDGSLLFILLYRYIKDFSPALRPASFHSAFADEMPFYHYASLYNLSFCE